MLHLRCDAVAPLLTPRHVQCTRSHSDSRMQRQVSPSRQCCCRSSLVFDVADDPTNEREMSLTGEGGYCSEAVMLSCLCVNVAAVTVLVSLVL